MDAQQIKALRRDLGMTVGALAEALHTETRIVLAWEAGDLFPTARHVQAMQRLRTPSIQAAHQQGTPAPTIDSGELGEIVQRLTADPEFLKAVRTLHESFKK